MAKWRTGRWSGAWPLLLALAVAPGGSWGCSEDPAPPPLEPADEGSATVAAAPASSGTASQTAIDSAPASGTATRDASQVRMPLAGFKAERGLCFIASIPLLTPNDRDDHKTGLRLFEDEVELTPAAAPHAEIRELGGGRFSHWGPTLYFSTSDGSDPNTSGRRYTIVFERAALVDDSLWAFTPIATIPAEEIRHGEGSEYIYDLPPAIAAWPSDSETLNGSRLVLLEDGVPLPLPHAQLAELKPGGGRYAHRAPCVLFTTSDNTDPRSNGREYAIALADPSDHRFSDPYAGRAPAVSETLAAPVIAWPVDGEVIGEARPIFRVTEPDPHLLYYWELDTVSSFDSPHLHRQPRLLQVRMAPNLLRAVDRDSSFAPEFSPSYRLGVLAPSSIGNRSPARTALVAGRLGFVLPTGTEEVREVYEYVHQQLYPTDVDANIREAEETWARDRGFCASVNLLASEMLAALGYRTRRALVSLPLPSRDPADSPYSHSSLEAFLDGRWSIVDPWFGFLLPGTSFQDLAHSPEAPARPAILSLAPAEDEEFAGTRRLLDLRDYAQHRRYDQFDSRYAPYTDAESERLAFSGEPAVILEPGWETLWMSRKMKVWVRVRSVNLPPEAIDRWMLPRPEARNYRPEVIEVSPWTTVSFTIDLAKAYGFEREE